MVVVIIDFDNYFGTDVSKLTKESLELTLVDVIIQCEQLFADFDRIQIRLYGGWYHGVTLTKQASVIQQILSQIDVFPKIEKGKIIRGDVDLVSSLFEIPNYSWQHTYKEKNGIPRIRINHEEVDDLCNLSRDSCPKFILYKFTQKKQKQCHVPGCDHLHKDVFKGIEQKMVDTMIACDVISTVKDSDIEGVLVLSDDQDHFPSYAIASKYSNRDNKIVVGVKNTDAERFNLISNILTPFNVKIITLP